MELPVPPAAIVSNWIQPGALVAGVVGSLGLLMSAFRGVESKLEKRIDEVKAEIKAGEERQRAEMQTLRTEMKAGEERQRAEMQTLRTEMKAEMRASEERQRAEMKASEERQKSDIQALRGDVKFLGDKLDRVLESFLAAKQEAASETAWRN